MNTLVYIGAGTDCIPLLMLDSIREFIYVDCQPKSEFGTLEFETGIFYRSNFLPRLDAILQRLYYMPIKQEDNYLEYRNTKGQTLKYYINTSFPEHLTDELREHMRSAENLMLAGFDPHKCALDLMPQLRNIYCNDNTVYSSDEYDSEYQKEVSVFRALSEHKGPYTYFLINQLEPFEIDENIRLEAKSVYTVERCDGLDNYYLKRPGRLT
jgi:hypothetical protein